MNLLLDTHTFIWWDSEPEKLSQQALILCQNPANTLLLSMVSIWEMQIKIQLGKLTLNLPLVEIIQHQQQNNNLKILPISVTHILALENLSNHHKDPFDRLLIAQSNIEDAVLVSCDPMIAKYQVKLVW
ncbi:type II toxin-antitoxin system VapC family toxin [Anabaena sp. UHCC 0187]|uniref:type II toxin-antitoxin system VapC family toxin n=1 Tax=Anabaena sp. UHCC 0187 TaxID=2590018 RepID=UPI0014464477|nr:type II toxin-antitoxin system VapC family toxin [Anabaena sp. UHCC 0187]MTJ12285.1 type II toxin-antitoxin system VapC family toxin [Anabaena sp. UHCC 0187]